MAPSLKLKAIEQLKADWKAENSDAREEGVQRWQLTEKVVEAKDRLKKDEENVEKLLVLAEAYGVIEPEDKRVMNVCERLMGAGINTHEDTHRQGDAYQMCGRSLFFADRFEEALQVLLKARACFHDNGSLKDRRQTNTGLLRAYSVLGRTKDAADRLEVALTQCRDQDQCIMLYMHAKNALDHTDVARDAEVLDDIWYVHMDMHPEVRDKFESYQQMCKGVTGTINPDDKEDETFMARLKQALRETVADAQNEPAVQMLFVIFVVIILALVFAASMAKAKR